MPKKHKILEDIESVLNGVQQTTEVRVAGRKFKLKLLSRNEERMARSMTTDESVMSMLNAFADSNQPQLAFAIIEIDGVEVSQLFEPSTDDERAAFEKNAAQWRGEQLNAWLGGRPTTVVEDLWMAYLKLKDRVKKTTDELEDFSNRTPSGS